MKKKLIIFLLAAALILCGCQKKGTIEEVPVTTEVEETVPVTIPADGNPDDVTCKGSYTGTDAAAVAAVSGTEKLTNEELSVWYWAEVSQYQQENQDIAPDFSQPLDTQICEIDSSVNSWQQYFLKQALSSWHTAQALIRHSQEVPIPTEEAYQPNLDNHATYMTGMPATKVLYGYNTNYTPNSMHQAYLDEIPQMLETMAQEKNYADVKEMADRKSVV